MVQVTGSATRGILPDTPGRGRGVPMVFLGIKTWVALALLAPMAWPLDRAAAQTATEFLEQARQYDSSYGAGPQVNRQKAIDLYEKALAAGPDRQQRVEALFRVGQLYGSIFDRQKGEKPDHLKAIAAYRQIAESYPPEEPMVMKTLGLISDHYMSLRRFEAALSWAWRAVEYDTARVEERIKNIHRRQDSLATTRYRPEERREIIEQAVRGGALQEDLERMKAGRVAAVDRVAAAARMLGPFLEDGELRAIAGRYRGTPVGDRAAQKLREAMERNQDLWAPIVDPPEDPTSAWQPPDSATGLLPQGRQHLDAPPDPHAGTDTGSKTPTPHTTPKPMGAVPWTKSPRAPPLLLTSAGVIVAAGLAVRRIRRKKLLRNREHET